MSCYGGGCISFLLIFGFFALCIPQQIGSAGSIELSYQYSLPRYEINALYDLYTVNHGDEWDWENDTTLYGVPWNFTDYLSTGAIPHVCQDTNDESQHWQGVECSSNCTISPCHIISLSLSEYGLDGSLTSSLSNLTWLSVLDVSNNKIVGSVPESLGSLMLLSVLSLSSNKLVGTLPSTMYSLSLLEYFAVDTNYLTGTLSDSIGLSWSLLKYFNIENCYFQGSLPSTLIDLYYLEYFIISKNPMLVSESFPMFSNMTTPNMKKILMQQVSLGVNTIPESYYTLSELKTLALGNTGVLYGTISHAIGNLQNLEILSLSVSSLSGSIPESISTLSKLSILDLEQLSAITGSLPMGFYNLTSLTQIYIADIYVSGTFPSLNYFPTLEHIELFLTQLTGSIPGYYGYLNGMPVSTEDGDGNSAKVPNNNTNKMVYYDVSYNHFHGTIPLSLSQCIYLEYIDLSSNDLTSTLPVEVFTNWTQLQQLRLAFNHFTNSLPTTIFESMHKLQYLDIADSLLSGTLPVDIVYNNPLLSTFNIENNILTGSIPIGLCDLHMMTSLSLQSNHFTSSLPICFYSNLSNLVTIGLDNNRLTGSFVTVNNWIHTLQEFHINNNLFTGYFPINGWNMMSNLIYVTATNNLFTGTFPSTLLQFNGTEVDLTNNMLTGIIPFEMTQGYGTTMYYLGYNELDGDITELFHNISTRISGLQLVHNLFTGYINCNNINNNTLQLSSLDLGNNFLTSK